MNLRRVLTIAGVALAGLLLLVQVRQLLADPTIWPPDDFIEYWAAARLTLNGENPYDPAKLLPLQQAAGRETDEAVMMWNPPWSLAVVLPLGLFPAREAQLLWLLVNLAAVAFCGDRLWLRFGGNRESRWIGWAAALAFLPTLFALQSGQIGPLLLLGAVLFLECECRGWPMLAGAATLLLAVKPHLAYLVWLAIALNLSRSSLKMILGGVAAGVLATLIALAFDPSVLAQYMDAMANRPPSQWVSPTLGTVLRLTFGETLFKLQFVPVLFGLAWFAWHWRARAATWNWTEELPLLLLVSFVTAPYGAWPFDMVLLLPAVLRLLVLHNVVRHSVAGGAGDRGEALRGCSDAPCVMTPPMSETRTTLRKPAILAALIAVNLGCLAMNLMKTGSFPFIWVSPALLVIYILGTRPQPEPRAAAGVVPA